MFAVGLTKLDLMMQIESKILQLKSSRSYHVTFPTLLFHFLQKKAEKVLSCHYQTVKHSITDNIVPEKVLKTRIKASNVELTEQEFEIVVCQLRKERLLSVQLLESGEKVMARSRIMLPMSPTSKRLIGFDKILVQSVPR